MPPSDKSRAAAMAAAGAVVAGVIAGLVVPRLLTQREVEYGDWPANTDFAQVRCVEGDVHVSDGMRQATGLLNRRDAGSSYCWYRSCFVGSLADAMTGMPQMAPGINPLVATRETAYTSGWAPLTVWCGSETAPSPCACAATPACKLTDGSAAPENVTLQPGEFTPGPGCLPAPCTVLAGMEDFPDACCKPRCGGKSCGPDGCGGTCGTCGSQFGPDEVTPVQLVCDAGAGRCCASPPCTPGRTPFHPEWPEP